MFPPVCLSVRGRRSESYFSTTFKSREEFPIMTKNASSLRDSEAGWWVFFFLSLMKVSRQNFNLSVNRGITELSGFTWCRWTEADCNGESPLCRCLTEQVWCLPESSSTSVTEQRPGLVCSQTVRRRGVLELMMMIRNKTLSLLKQPLPVLSARLLTYSRLCSVQTSTDSSCWEVSPPGLPGPSGRLHSYVSGSSTGVAVLMNCLFKQWLFPG